MHKSFYSLFLISTFLTMVGCVATPSIGAAPAATPPQIIVDPDDNKKTKWDHPEAFGPIPESLAVKAQKSCSRLDTDQRKFKAIGYHPEALDIDGKKFKGGGYFCVSK